MDHIVIQMRNANREKGHCVTFDCRFLFVVFILRKVLREDPSDSQLVACVHPAAPLRAVGLDVHKLLARRPLLLSLV